jgi:LysM repeat protein
MISIDYSSAGRVRRVAAITIGIAVLAACSSDDASSTETAGALVADTGGGSIVASSTPANASYTIAAGDTLSDVAARAGVSLADLVDANGWPDGQDHLIVPGDVINLPSGAAVPPASAGTSDTPAATSGSAATQGGYAPTTGTNPTSLSTNEKTDPIVTPLPDGQYWSWDYTSNGDSVDFTLVQFFVGDACREQFGDSDDACASDNNTLDQPSTTVRLAEGAATSVVSCCDSNASFRSYRISADEFIRLVAGRAPAADAPGDFNYSDYGVLVTVENGLAIAAEQRFTS